MAPDNVASVALRMTTGADLSITRALTSASSQVGPPPNSTRMASPSRERHLSGYWLAGHPAATDTKSGHAIVDKAALTVSVFVHYY